MTRAVLRDPQVLVDGQMADAAKDSASSIVVLTGAGRAFNG
jgi:hypothetical protein